MKKIGFYTSIVSTVLFIGVCFLSFADGVASRYYYYYYTPDGLVANDVIGFIFFFIFSVILCTLRIVMQKKKSSEMSKNICEYILLFVVFVGLFSDCLCSYDIYGIYLAYIIIKYLIFFIVMVNIIFKILELLSQRIDNREKNKKTAQKELYELKHLWELGVITEREYREKSKKYIENI